MECITSTQTLVLWSIISFEHPKIYGWGFSLPQSIIFRENTEIRWASKLIVSQKNVVLIFTENIYILQKI